MPALREAHTLTPFHHPTAPLPEPPSYAHWPASVISAELLHGTLVRCGPGVRGVGWPDDPRTRAAALAPWYMKKRTAILTTAAWIWGVIDDPGTPLLFSTARGRSSFHTPRTLVLIREIRIPASEQLALGNYRVTTPMRTLCDLLRDTTELTQQRRIACRLLMLRKECSRKHVESQLRKGTQLGRKRALNRLHEC